MSAILFAKAERSSDAGVPKAEGLKYNMNLFFLLVILGEGCLIYASSGGSRRGRNGRPPPPLPEILVGYHVFAYPVLHQNASK